MLRAKSLSLLYSYPGCPILRSLGLYGLRMTEKYVLSAKFIGDFLGNSSNYKREQFLAKLNDQDFMNPKLDIKIDERTRLLVEQMYGVTVKVQLEAERYLDELDKLQPLKLDLPFPAAWRHYYSSYSVELDRYSRDVSFVKTGYHTDIYTGPNNRVVIEH